MELALDSAPREAAAIVLESLRAIGFTEAGLKQLLGLSAGAPRRLYLAVAAEPTLVLPEEGPGPLDVATLLFIGCQKVRRSEVEGALGAETLRILEEVRFVRDAGDRTVQAEGALIPLGPLYLSCDSRMRRMEKDYVYFPDESALKIARFLEAPGGEGRAIDVGAGSGYLALLMGRLGHRGVLGVDPCERAVHLARFGAWLNGVDARFEVGTFTTIAERQVGDTALLTFCLPNVLTVPLGDTLSVFAKSSLVNEVYAGLPRILRPEGRALTWHQFREPVEEKAAPLVAPVLDAARDFVWVPSPTPVPRVEFGVGMVEPAYEDGQRGELHTLPLTLGGRDELSRAEVTRFLYSRRLVQERDGEELQELVPVLGATAAAHRAYRPAARGLAPLEGVFIGDVPYPDRALELLEACDGQTDIAALTRRWPDALPYLRNLVEFGVLWLRQA